MSVSTTEKNIAQFFLQDQEAKSKQRTNLNLKKSFEEWIRRIEVVIHFQVVMKGKTRLYTSLLILYYAAADSIGEKVSGYVLT